jgi:hypothetical protein
MHERWRVCVRVDLLIQATYCLRPLAPAGLSTLFHKRHDFFKKNSLNIKCVFSLSLHLLFETLLELRRNQRDIVINVKTSSWKVPVMSVGS